MRIADPWRDLRPANLPLRRPSTVHFAQELRPGRDACDEQSIPGAGASQTVLAWSFEQDAVRTSAGFVEVEVRGLSGLVGTSFISRRTGPREERVRTGGGKRKGMNAVEIEEAVSELASAHSTPASFRSPSSPLSATRKRPSSGCARAHRTSPTLGGVLQTNNIHIAVCEPGEVTQTLAALRASPARRERKAQVHPRDRWRDVRSGGLGDRRDGRLHLPGLPGPFRLLPAARRHHDRQANPRELVRHQGHRPPQPALRRAAEGQSRLGHRRAPPRHEPFHGAADLLLLRREIRTSSSATDLFTATDRADERAATRPTPMR